MKNKIIYILMITLILICLGSIYGYTIPSEIRVGIYAYNSEDDHVYKALHSLTISSNTGLIAYEVGTSDTTITPRELFRVGANVNVKVERIGSYNGNNFVSVSGGGNYVEAGNSSKKYVRIEQVSGGTPLIDVRQRVSCDADTVNPSVGALRFRGSMEFRRMSGSDMTGINSLSLDDYLKGVVPAEIGTTSNIESLKAQGVAARTYTVYNMGKRAPIGCDLIRTQSDQAYLGYNAESSNTNSAVSNTTNQVLLVGGNPFATMYSSTNGKYTERPADMWNSSSNGGFGNTADPFDAGDYFEQTFTADQMRQRIIQRYSVDVGQVTDIQISSRSSSGKITGINVVGTSGSYNVGPGQGFELRRLFWVIVDPTESGYYTSWGTPTSLEKQSTQMPVVSEDTQNNIYINQGQVATESNVGIDSGNLGNVAGKSNLTIKGLDKTVNAAVLSTDKYVMKGYANSHAIGMSQTGAQSRAAAGQSYQQILGIYYPGATLTNAEVNQVYAPFKDVALDYWGCSFITAAKNNAWVSGDNGYFYPEKVVSRAEASSMIAKAEGLYIDSVTSSGYSDVPTSFWGYKCIGKLRELGYYNAFGWSQFNPDNEMTREELFVLANKLSTNVADKGIANNFSDKNSISAYALTAVNNLISKGIISGSDNLIRPQASITKTETIVIAAKLKGIV